MEIDKQNFGLFVAFENNYGIAYNNNTPWRLPNEFKYYIVNF
jgi:hypothetical protein